MLFYASTAFYLFLNKWYWGLYRRIICVHRMLGLYAWEKTEVGALQLQKMPWDLKNEAKNYLAASLFSFFVRPVSSDYY